MTIDELVLPLVMGSLAVSAGRPAHVRESNDWDWRKRLRAEALHCSVTFLVVSLSLQRHPGRLCGNRVVLCFIISHPIDCSLLQYQYWVYR